MRFFSLIFIMLSLAATAQLPADYCKQIKNIARFEQQAHQRIAGQGNNIVTNALSNNFDVKYYRCEWEVDPAVRYITGKVTIYYVVVAATNNIQLDLMSPLVVDSVKQRGAQLTKLHASNVVTINFPATVNAGVLDSVTVYYKGVPIDTGFGSFDQATHAGVPVLWTLSEPYGSRDWWPCKNGLDDKADSIDIFVTSPVAYKAAANGLLQSETLVAGGTKKTAWWKHRYPIATYLVCFAVTNYAVFNNTVTLGSTVLPMQTYCYPESQASFQSGTQNTLNALQLFHTTFGDYPFIKEKYGHVQFNWGGGMEHQTSTFVISIDEGLCAHELGHQWFGDKITCGSWEDVWLNEGFATFLASYYIENKYPSSIISNRRYEINDITSSPGGSVWVNDTSSVNRIFDGRLSYEKGSHLLYMLRWKLGDSAFFRGLRAYQKDPAVIYGFARTADLQRNLENASGQNLTEFFKDWFKGQGYPSYNVEWTQLGASYIKIKMNQTTSHPSVDFFELPVALKFKNATQEKTIVLDNTSNGQEFTREIGFVADTVLVDPDYWLITRNNTTTKRVDNTGGTSVQVFPNPMQDNITVYVRNLSTNTAGINIYNEAGQRVFAKNYPLINGTEFLNIPVQALAKGVYMLTVRAGSKLVFKTKLLK